ncbi:MAG: T9SS type A sorting domain-containing protein [Bacteroidia bacterium]
MKPLLRISALAALLVCLAFPVLSQRQSSTGQATFPQSVATESAKVTGGICDTINYGFPIPGPGVLYTSNGWGFVGGHNDYGDLAFAERIENLNGFSQVFGIRFSFGQASSSGPNAKVIARVWPEVSGQPGTAIYSQDLLIDDIIAGFGNVTVNFPSPVSVNGAFYVGYEVTYAAGDTVAAYTTRDSTVYPATAWSKFSDGSWYPFDNSDSWSLASAFAIYPRVLSGNLGLTVLPANPTISLGGQVQLNASGGLNPRWFPATGLSCTQCPNPIASPTTTTTYSIVAWDSTQTCTELVENTVFVNAVGIEDGLFGGAAQVYPNPSNGSVMLDFVQNEIADLTISVFSDLGQVVYEQPLAAFSGKFHAALPMEGLAHGLYTLQVTDGERKFICRLVLQ